MVIQNKNLQVSRRFSSDSRPERDCQFLTSIEAAAHLNISKSTLYKHTSAGKIPHYKPGGKLLLFLKQDLDQFALRYRIPSNDELLE